MNHIIPPARLLQYIKTRTYMWRILVTIMVSAAMTSPTQAQDNSPACFQSSISPDTTILDSILLIQVFPTSDQDIQTIIGTGFVVEGQRIMTARHIFHHGVYRIRIYNRYGQLLGFAGTDFDANSPTAVDPQEQIMNDTVTLHMIPNDDGSTGIDTLTPIVYVPHNSLGTMSVSIPFGIAGGASGAPILDTQGNAIGVVSAATTSTNTIPVSGNYPSILHQNASTDQFPSATFTFVSPIPGGQSPIPDQGTVIIPSYPKGHCVLYEGTMIRVPHLHMILNH